MQARPTGNLWNLRHPYFERDTSAALSKRPGVYISTQMESARGKRYLTMMEGSPASDLSPIDLPETESAACSTSNEQGSGRQLAALTVALGQASNGKWYVSTLQLQLASFDVCVSCRGVRTLRVTIDKRIPLSFWGDDDSFRDSLRTPRRRRVPALRAAGVAWTMPAGMLVPVLSQSALLRGAEWMQLTGVDCGGMGPDATALSRWDDSISLPVTRPAHSASSYFEAMITFLGREVVPIRAIRSRCSLCWPSALRELSIGCLLYELVDWAALPSSLERLALGGWFDQEIDSVPWPVSLKHLTLGGCFSQPIADVVWPTSLVQLTFGVGFNQPITDVVWPASLLELAFWRSFDKPITSVAWPDSLLSISFGDKFNQPITHVVWPVLLKQLAFGDFFDQPIIDVAWPGSLINLVFGNSFDKPITEVLWPASLNRLVFGDDFNHPIDAVAWPSGLQSLAFGTAFDQPMEYVVWPASLRWLAFHFNHRASALAWPPSLNVSMYPYGSAPKKSDDQWDWPPERESFEQPMVLCLVQLDETEWGDSLDADDDIDEDY